MPNLTIVIPAYAEEENLRVLLPRINKVIKSIGLSSEVLIIDTMMPMDNTKQAVNENSAKYINREGGNNYGDAVRTAIKYASGEYILFMDGDGSHAPEYIYKLIEHIKENDVVVASRYVDGGATDNPDSLIIMSKIVNVLYSVILNLNCKDVSNSFKVYNTDSLKKLKLYCNNFDIIEEILYKLKLNNKNLKIKEISFIFKKRMFGSTKRNLFVFMFLYFITLLKLRFGR